MEITKFNIRVYGLIINHSNEVLISEEMFNKDRLTKFPGGGMEFGEGTVDCLHREAMEELKQEIVIKEHFYTTEDFVPTIYFKDRQLIAIYYLAKLKAPANFKASTKPFDFIGDTDGLQSFRWIEIETLNEIDFSFSQDKLVALKLKKHFKNG